MSAATAVLPALVQTRYVAVDVHRRTLFVVIWDHRGEEIFHGRFPHNTEGEEQLLAKLRPDDMVVLEATTGSRRLANLLETTGARAFIADPQYARVGLRGKKTDYRDCRDLLRQFVTGKLPTVWRPDARTRLVRQLTQERCSYNGTITRLKNRIHAVLAEEGLTPPEALWTQEGQQWLCRQPDGPLVRLLIRQLALLQEAETIKAHHEQELTELAIETAEAQQLMQLLGCGPSSAIMVLGEIGSVDRFPSDKKIVSYAGLDPSVHDSGERHYHGRISKAGRRQLRWIMVEIAWAHVHSDGPEAALYHRLVKHKPKGVAIVALARHLLVLMYKVLRRGENYRKLQPEQYERKLQELGYHRPFTGDDQESNVLWGAHRFEAITSMPSPYLAAHPTAGRRPQRRRPKETRQVPSRAPALRPWV